MALRTGFIEAGNGRLFYQLEGEGPPLVFLHGFGLDLHMWDSETARFSEERAVLRYDLRGFGRSAMPVSPYSHVDDLQSVLKHLGLSNIDLVGSSMGGGVAIDFALTYPQAVRSLVLVDTIVGGFRGQPGGTGMGAAFAAAKTGGADAGRAAWLESPLFTQAMQVPAIAEQLRQMVGGYSGWHFVNSVAQRVLTPPAWERLRDLGVPSLVLVGALDLPDFRAIAERLMSELPDVRGHVIEGAGHLPNLEAPVRFQDQLLRFFAELDARAQTTLV